MGFMTRQRQNANIELCNMFTEFSCLLGLVETRRCNSGCPYGGLAADRHCDYCPSDRQGECCQTGKFRTEYNKIYSWSCNKAVKKSIPTL